MDFVIRLQLNTGKSMLKYRESLKAPTTYVVSILSTAIFSHSSEGGQASAPKNERGAEISAPQREFGY